MLRLGLAHQRKKARRGVSAAVMAGLTTSMLATIIISRVMVWLLTDGRQASATGQNEYAQSKRSDERAARRKFSRAGE